MPGFRFVKLDLADRDGDRGAVRRSSGFRTSCISRRRPACAIRSTNPHAYVDANSQGFINMLEGCRHDGCRHLLYRLVVVGLWRQHQAAVLACTTMSIIRISLYAATKKANELMAHTYAIFTGCRRPGLRFFTVYGPWGRPDMAMLLFAKAIMRGQPIRLFNHGNMRRDFTYVDDVVEGGRAPGRSSAAPQSALVGRRSRIPATQRRALADLQHRQQPAGRSSCMSFELLEKALGRKAEQASCCRCSRATCRDDLCRCRRPDARGRLQALDPDRRRRARASSPGIATITRLERPMYKKTPRHQGCAGR